MADHSEKKCRDCGTMQVHRRLLDTDRNYARRLAKIEDHAFRAAAAGAMRPGCTRIPVVVHVVYKTAAQNVSQAQIDSQIDILNKDFRKKNADISQVPAPFSPLAGDARIEFVLASEDPDGNPTDGVTRTQTNESSFNSNDDIKFDARGGKDAWPADEYLNIWVGKLSGGLLGYAQFPGGPAATDGVVCTHTGFGDTGTAAAPFDKGRTATHEIGHWLNLRHIWGDDGNGCSGTDFVADTPNQGGSNVGKPTFPSISCGNGPNGDMFMNYMDYVDDDTMVMFTEGQITRMQACLDGARSSIGETIPCITVTPKPIPKDGPKDFAKDIIKEFPKDGPKDFGKDFPKDGPKDFGKDFPKDGPKDFGKDFPKDGPKDGPKDFGKDFPKDIPKDLPKDPPKEIKKEGPKDFPKEGIYDPGPKNIWDDVGPKLRDPGPKSLPKESPFDPGPKYTPKEGPYDPGPKVRDPGPKIFDPGPKTIFEGPGGFPGGPLTPMQPAGPQIMPFVLGTGDVSAGQMQGQPPGYDPQRDAEIAHQQAMLGQYAMLLGAYADFYQRGLLDQQGMAAWQQVYEAYAQMGGS